MYDKHPDFEYAIYCRVNNATPYIAHIYSSMREVEEYFKAMETRHNRYHHIYYIDTVGYDNKYSKEFAMFYYKLLKRPVNDWQEIA